MIGVGYARLVEYIVLIAGGDVLDPVPMPDASGGY